MNLSILKNFYTEHRRGILLTAFSILFFAVLCTVAFAQTTPAPTGRPNPLGADNGAGFDIFKPLAELIYVIALGVGGVFVFVGGLALDLSIQQLIIQFGGLFNSAFGQGVVSVWQIIRDVFNIVFIFAFIYIGIRTILNSEDSGTRRAIGNLIVAALFINFSLLISQAIIDFSNVAATQIYNHITTGGVGASGIDGTFSNELMDLGQNSISGAFLNLTNLTTLFGGDTDIIKDPKMTASKILVYSILMMVFLVLAGFIFLFAAIHIIYRFVALIIYMILSPVLFAGLILPNFQSYTKKWLHGLLKQSFFAPAFLFLIYVSLLSMKTLRESLVLGGGFQDVTKGGAMDVNEFGIFLFFAITIGFIYASVKVGDMMGIAGAGATLKVVDGARKGIQGAVAGAAYRGTVGAGLNRVVKGIDALDQKAEAGSRGARFARTIIGGESTRKAIDKASNYGAGGGLGRDAVEKQNKERTARATRAIQVDKINDAIKAGGATMERAVRDASDAQLLEIAESKGGEEKLISISGKLSASQVKDLTKSDKLTDEFKSKFHAERAKQIRERIEALDGTYSKANKADLAAIGPDGLAKKEIAVLLSEKQLDGLDFADVDKDMIKKAREDALIEVAQGNQVGTYTIDMMKKMKAEDIASLPNKVFEQDTFTKTLSATSLSEIGKKKNDAVQATIRKTLEHEIQNISSSASQAELDRLAAVDVWFTTNPYGRMFGK